VPAQRRRNVQHLAVRGGHADFEHLRSQVPLHETADELCAVSQTLGLKSEDVLLGERATEANVKQLSAYRVVYFATHGTIAGEIEGTTGPGLILTPPKERTEKHNGYLSSSEVAALKLDADWVVLSACNTAAGGAQDTEALSGLARALMYAGARALLVSHWAVDSAATAKLVADAVGATARDKYIGRTAALRRAMLTMIDKGKPHEAHPTF
jgi:CHAT domain-containing protein